MDIVKELIRISAETDSLEVRLVSLFAAADIKRLRDMDMSYISRKDREAMNLMGITEEYLIKLRTVNVCNGLLRRLPRDKRISDAIRLLDEVID